jgi:hypothetical protein
MPIYLRWQWHSTILLCFTITTTHTQKHKALKAMYEVLKMGRLYKLSVKIQLDLFDKMIKPILLYGCEVWGFGK